MGGSMSSNPDAPESSCFQHEMELPGAKRGRICKPRHDIFLSHSGQERAFVEQLYHDLKRRNQRPFFDQDSDCLRKAEKFAPEILEAAEQCRVGVVVVSEGYLTSKWPMLELSKFVECGVKVFPLFFKLSPSDLKGNKAEAKWKRSWRQLVKRGEVKEEVVEMWSKAVKALRSSNGLEYGKYANSEYQYRCAVVEEICKVAPPIFEWSTDGIQGCERLCKVTSSMFVEAKVTSKEESIHKYLGIYGMGGVGKTTLCKSMCSYSVGEFGGRVFHLELPSDEGNAGKERLGRLKHVVQRFARFDKSISEAISTEAEGWECLRNGLVDQPPVFLAIDNIGDFEASREEARRYLRVGLPSGSKVLMTARSGEIVKSVLPKAEHCKPIPRLEVVEAATLFLAHAAPGISSVSSLNPEEREIVEQCLSQCEFEDSGYRSRQYHPLVLRALGTYFHDVGCDDVMRWSKALKNENKLQRSREGRNVYDILGLNYHSLSEQVKLVFLDCVLYYTRESWRLWWHCPWWSDTIELHGFEGWVLWISEVHGVSPLEAQMMVQELQRLSLVEDSSSKVSIHDLYKEFARVLVEKEGSKEWQWWMSQSSDSMQLKRLVLYRDWSIIGVAPRRFVEWRSLVLLELERCDDIGPDLDVGGFHSLRVLSVVKCRNVKRITCRCEKSYDDGVCCHKRNPGRGCMSELVSVRLYWLESLEGIPFLRHCWSLERFQMEVVDGSIPPIYPASCADSDCDEAIDFRYLQALQTFSFVSHLPMVGYDCGAFIRWLLSALQLKNLIAFEYRSSPVRYEDMEGVGGYTIDLNEVVGLAPRLSVLCVRLPWQIEEVKGLHLLPELTTLNLNYSRGLCHLPDMRWLPKLKWLCVGWCCRLEGRPSVGPGFGGIPVGARKMNHADFADHECLEPYCDNKENWWCSPCYKRMGGEEDYEGDYEDGTTKVQELQRLSVLEDSDSEVSIHDLYKEFARVLVEKEGSKEWQWWMSQSSDSTQLKRLVLELNQSIIGVALRRFVEWRSLVVLTLYDYEDIEPDLNIEGFHSLRVSYIDQCGKVKRILCSYSRGYDDGVCCHKRNPARGCISQLLSVSFKFCLRSLRAFLL